MKVIIHNGMKDSKGHYQDKTIIGRLFMHTGNHKLYRVEGYVWHGDDDTWHVLLQKFTIDRVTLDMEDCDDTPRARDASIDSTMVRFTRSIENFKGRRNDQPRFIKVER